MVRQSQVSQKLVAIMILVYGDESMDETKQRVCAVAGVVGTELGWQAIQHKWLARTDGIPFHANNCDSDFGDYVGTPHEENKALYRDLAIMLAESGLGGWGMAIDLAAHRREFPESPDLSYYKAFLSVVEAMKNCAANNGEIADITFDTRMESEHNAGLLYAGARENEPEWRPFLGSKVSFESSKDNPRIQVADLLAREAMKALDNVVGPKKRGIRKSWAALSETGRFHVDALSDDWFADLKRHMPQLEEKTGLHKGDYLEWLKVRNRQHNVTNLIHFMNQGETKRGV